MLDAWGSGNGTATHLSFVVLSHDGIVTGNTDDTESTMSGGSRNLARLKQIGRVGELTLTERSAVNGC